MIGASVRRLVLLSALACCGALPARAEYPVWDAEEIARLAEKSAQMAESLSVAVELLNNVNELGRTIGRSGPLSSLDFARFDVVEGLKGAGPELAGLAGNIAGLQDSRIRSFGDASAVARRLITVPEGAGRSSREGQLRQTAEALYRKALEDGYALAEHSRESLAVAPRRAALLVGQASSKVDLRGDTTANSAASLAVLEQLVAVKALLASILEIESVQRLRRTRPATAGSP